MGNFVGYTSKKSRIIIFILLVIALVALMVVAVSYHNNGKVYTDDLILSSPDEKYELVIREWGTIGATGAEIYIRETSWWNRWIKTKIGNASADDGVYPFSSGLYHVEWKTDKVTILSYGGHPSESVEDPSSWRCVVEYQFS